MNRLTPALVIGLLIMLAACAPTASSPSEPSVPAPTIVETPASELLELTLEVDGSPVTLEAGDDAWFYFADDYAFGVSVEPTTFEAVNQREYDAYRERHLFPATGMMIDLLRSGPTGFAFSLANDGDGPIRIVWDESAFILPNGNSSRVIHLGVRYQEMNSSQPATIVPPGGRIDEYAGPTANISLSSSNWVTDPLFGELSEGDRAVLYLALEVNGERHTLEVTATATGSHSRFIE